MIQRTVQFATKELWSLQRTMHKGMISTCIIFYLGGDTVNEMNEFMLFEFFIIKIRSELNIFLLDSYQLKRNEKGPKTRSLMLTARYASKLTR